MFLTMLLLIQSYTGLYNESAITSYNQLQPKVSVSVSVLVPKNTKSEMTLPEIKPMTISINRSIETSA